MRTERQARPDAPTRNLGLPGRAAVSSAMAGGVLTGGFLIATMTMAERLSGHAVLVTLIPLFLVGAIYGYLQGGVIGVLGRPEGMTAGQALRAVAKGSLYAVLGLAVTFIVAGWIALTFVALYTERTLAVTIAVAGWVAGIGILGWATREGTRALGTALGRARRALAGAGV